MIPRCMQAGTLAAMWATLAFAAGCSRDAPFVQAGAHDMEVIAVVAPDGVVNEVALSIDGAPVRVAEIDDARILSFGFDRAQLHDTDGREAALPNEAGRGDLPSPCGRCVLPLDRSPALALAGQACAPPAFAEVTADGRAIASDASTEAVRAQLSLRWPGECACEPPASIARARPIELDAQLVDTTVDPWPMEAIATSSSGAIGLFSERSVVAVDARGGRLERPAEELGIVGPIVGAVGLPRGFLVSTRTYDGFDGPANRVRWIDEDLSRDKLIPPGYPIDELIDVRVHDAAPSGAPNRFALLLSGVLAGSRAIALSLCEGDAASFELDCTATAFEGPRAVDLADAALGVDRMAAVIWARAYVTSALTIAARDGRGARTVALPFHEDPIRVSVAEDTIYVCGTQEGTTRVLALGAGDAWAPSGEVPASAGRLCDDIVSRAGGGVWVRLRDGTRIDVVPGRAARITRREPPASGWLAQAALASGAVAGLDALGRAWISEPDGRGLRAVYGDPTLAAFDTEVVLAREHDFVTFGGAPAALRTVRFDEVGTASIAIVPIRGLPDGAKVVAGARDHSDPAHPALFIAGEVGERRFLGTLTGDSFEEIATEDALSERVLDIAETEPGVLVLTADHARVFRWDRARGLAEVPVVWDDPTTAAAEGEPLGCPPKGRRAGAFETPWLGLDGSKGAAWISSCSGALLRVLPGEDAPRAVRVQLTTLAVEPDATDKDPLFAVYAACTDAALVSLYGRDSGGLHLIQSAAAGPRPWTDTLVPASISNPVRMLGAAASEILSLGGGALLGLVQQDYLAPSAVVAYTNPPSRAIRFPLRLRSVAQDSSGRMLAVSSSGRLMLVRASRP